MDLIGFDLDDTLINADRAHYKVYNKALQRIGYKKLSFNVMKKFFGKPKLDFSRAIAPEASLKELRFIRDYHYKNLGKELPDNAKKIKGVIKALKKIREHYKIGILSNNNHSNIIKSLRVVGINKNLFDVIIGNDDVRHSKPMPDEIFKAQKLTHSKARYMVGDSIYDMMAGRKARVKTIGVLTGSYSYYMLKKYKPYRIIKSVADLPRLLKI